MNQTEGLEILLIH